MAGESTDGIGGAEGAALRVPTLADYVRDRRSRSLAGYPAGMTRKELAAATHASLGYIAKIEQGEAFNPGAAILDSLATVLELDAANRAHLYHLAQQRPSAQQSAPLRAPDPTIRTTLDALLPHVAAVLDDGWQIIDHNAAFDTALPGLTRGKHVLRWLFTDPRARLVLEEWEREAQLLTGRFRAYAACAPERADVVEVLRDLNGQPDFRRMWSAGHVCIGRPDPVLTLRNPRTATVYDVLVQRYRSTAPGPAHQVFIGLTP